jgi:Icc-related predicted phosphoesterase
MPERDPPPDLRPAEPRPDVVRVAAAGDVHAHEGDAARLAETFAPLRTACDLVLLAGDLTTHGEPEQARALADACRDIGVPVLAVLGNHDWHADRHDELAAVLQDGGIQLLEREHVIVPTDAGEVGIVGAKGFVGGFAGSHLPDFGEPLLRRLYAETTADVATLDAGLRAIALCPVRIVLLHYSPTGETLRGEPPGIWTMLGNDRLAAPINEHEPDLVVHGHAHAGTFEGRIGTVAVYNVAVPVMGQDFWIFELPTDRRSSPMH